MTQLVYKAGQRRHLFAVRHLLPDPSNEDCYVAGPLVAVYSSTDPVDVIHHVAQESSVFPPYAVVHVTGYMLALAHQARKVSCVGRGAWWRGARALLHVSD
jgi:hypothetical protein